MLREVASGLALYRGLRRFEFLLLSEELANDFGKSLEFGFEGLCTPSRVSSKCNRCRPVS